MGFLDALKNDNALQFFGAEVKVKSIPHSVWRVWGDDVDGEGDLYSRPTLLTGGASVVEATSKNSDRLKPEDRIYAFAVKNQLPLPMIERRFVEYYDSFVFYVRKLQISAMLGAAKAAGLLAVSGSSGGLVDASGGAQQQLTPVVLVPDAMGGGAKGASKRGGGKAAKAKSVSKKILSNAKMLKIKSTDVMQTRIVAYVRRPDQKSSSAAAAGALGTTRMAVDALGESHLVWDEGGKFYHDYAATK